MATKTKSKKKLVASIVLNGVIGDSRVIKTAKAAELAGYQAILFGLGENPEPQEIDVEGTKVILVRNPALELKKRKLWSSAHKPFRAMVDMAAEAITEQVVRFAPDLVHSHDMLGLRVGSVVSRTLAARGTPTPWVHDLHEFVAGLTTLAPESVELFVEYERLYLRQTDHLITVSPALAEEVQSRYKLVQSPTVVLNAPEYRKSFESTAPDVRSAIGLDEGAKLVVYVGGAKKERGCDTIVEATASLPGVHICFVSNSDRYIDSLRELATSLGMASRFHTHPYVPSDQVTSFIRTANVGTHGLIHYPNGEVALPNKLFEYLQAGVPMVLSDVASMKAFVEEHGVGRIFIAKDSHSCALAIRSALADATEIRARMTETLKRRFSWQTQAAIIRDIYGELLGSGPKLDGVVVDNNKSLEAMWAEVPEAAILYVGLEEPRSPVAFRFDAETEIERSGILSLVASRFKTLRLHDSPSWPSAAELLIIGSAGVDVTISGRTTKLQEFAAASSGMVASGPAGVRRAILVEYETDNLSRAVAVRKDAETALPAPPLTSSLSPAIKSEIKELKTKLALAEKQHAKLLALYQQSKKSLNGVVVTSDRAEFAEDQAAPVTFLRRVRSTFFPKTK